MKYKIIVRYFRNEKDLEAGRVNCEFESGFCGLTLKEAQTCLSKMSGEKVNGMVRQNLIIGNSYEVRGRI